MSNKKAALVAAKPQERAVDAWAYYDDDNGNWCFSFVKPKCQAVAKCPKCKHSHGIKWYCDEGFEMDEAQVRKLGIDPKQETIRKIVLASTEEEV